MTTTGHFLRSFVGVCWLLLGATAARAEEPAWVVRAGRGMVASDRDVASQIGAEILAHGGNAFDAAIATSLALTVARGESTGIGGGGFMLAYVARDKQFVALDFREMAPAAATAERYAKLAEQRRARAASQPTSHAATALQAASQPASAPTTATADAGGPPPALYGGNAVGVPGLLAGLVRIHEQYATLPWASLVTPARLLAREGFVVDDHYVDACKSVYRDLEKWPELRTEHKALYEALLGGGEPPTIGTRIVRPGLAAALELIALDGADAFYRGQIGSRVVAAVRAAGGAMTEADLEGYQVRPRTPLRAKYRDFELVTMPPPSSGGICIIETLNLLTAYRARAEVVPPFKADATYYDMLLKSMRHAFADRARWLGDPDFSTIPVALLTDPNYAAQLADKPVRDPNACGTAQLPEDRGTSHFCVADAAGNVVAITETVNGPFGSLVLAEPYGIVLNNQMDDFAAEPGKPNLYGLIQGAANAVAPDKRPLSSMTPTIVLRDGKPVLVLGASGGPLIITSVLQVMLGVLDFELPLADAMMAPRVHHQWLPDEVKGDRLVSEALRGTLRELGYTVNPRRSTGIVQAIQFLTDGTLVGASDPRKGGKPAGVEKK